MFEERENKRDFETRFKNLRIEKKTVMAKEIMLEFWV